MMSADPTAWRDLLAEYIKAERRYDETNQIMDRAQRLAWKHLAKRVGDERAYELAGIGLADRRNMRAYGAMKAARDRLEAAMKGKSIAVRTRVFGTIMYMYDRRHRRPLNDNAKAA